MAFYVSLDGDDIGSKIATAYLENDEHQLTKINQDLSKILSQICEDLKRMGFHVIFCAADGIVCRTSNSNIDVLIKYMEGLSHPGFTFSVGVGLDLRSAFFALKYAKSTGKSRIVILKEDASFQIIIKT